MAEVEPERFASDRGGVLHLITDYHPRAEVYVAACGAYVPSRSAHVSRGQPPGMLCRKCSARRYAQVHHPWSEVVFTSSTMFNLQHCAGKC